MLPYLKQLREAGEVFRLSVTRTIRHPASPSAHHLLPLATPIVQVSTAHMGSQADLDPLYDEDDDGAPKKHYWTYRIRVSNLGCGRRELCCLQSPPCGLATVPWSRDPAIPAHCCWCVLHVCCARTACEGARQAQRAAYMLAHHAHGASLHTCLCMLPREDRKQKQVLLTRAAPGPALRLLGCKRRMPCNPASCKLLGQLSGSRVETLYI